MPQYRTLCELHIRTAAGPQHPALPGSPLAKGTVVEQISAQGHWWKVDVQEGAPATLDLDGWVNSKFLERVS